MIITRTPYRLSFFGGGTDYPAWYLQHGGEVLATSFNKYCYITCRYLPPFFDHRFRVVWSKTELCQSVEEITHPAVREILRFLNIDRGMEIHHEGDLPARSGIGSSSSFMVGLLHAIYALKGYMPSKYQQATESIHIEQNLLKETVGSQDQVMAAYGGLNYIRFEPGGAISVVPITVTRQRVDQLDNHLMLFYTGIKRTASEIADGYVKNIQNSKDRLVRMKEMVHEAMAILNSDEDLFRFGELLHESWMAKRSLSANVSNSYIDELYNHARSAGAIGGKLIGAGGGGFMLLFVPPGQQSQVRERLKGLIHVPFRFEFNGSQVILMEPEEDYSSVDQSHVGSITYPFRELSEIGMAAQARPDSLMSQDSDY